MTEIKKANLSELVQDDRNLNRGTEKGQQLISKSLREFGAGRSVLIDKNNRIIAGNKTHRNAEAAGIKDVIIVETDGTQLVAVKRTDVDLDTKQGREMALADNATVKVDLAWDVDEMESVTEDFGIIAEDWGIEQEKKKDEVEADVPFTEILGEEHNYVVLYCDDEVDWLQMQSVFDIGRARELSTARGYDNVNARKIGIGRIIKWQDAWKRLRENENIG